MKKQSDVRGKCWKSTAPLLLVGSTEICPEISFLTGFRTSDPVICMVVDGVAYLVVSRIEYDRAARAAGPNVFTPEMLGVAPQKRTDAGVCSAALLRKFHVRSVRVTSDFPLGLAEKLKRRGVRLLLRAEELACGRIRKSAEEIRRMAEVQQAAVIAMRVATEMIARAEIDEKGWLRARGERLTAELVKRAIRRVLLDHDCFCRDVIVACGAQGAHPHEQGSGPLRAREPIVIDIFPTHLEHGYWGDLTRTIVRGGATPTVKHMYGAVRAAQAAALAAIRPGVSGQAVHRAAENEFSRKGCETSGSVTGGGGFGHTTGHGIGLALHEAPVLGADAVRLKAGMVLAVEPGLYDPRVGGIRIEDVVVVTADGWKYLAPCERRLDV